jgi:purine operon repressor
LDHIRRNERMAALTKLLTSAPNRIFTLSHFCELFNAAKSTLSEDIDLLKGVFARFELGQLETVTGAAGGVRYRRAISRDKALGFVSDLCSQLATTSRVLPGGFLYLSDILSQHELVSTMGTIIA